MNRGTVESLLSESNYVVASFALSKHYCIYFEDASIFGFVAMFDEADDLLSEWHSVHTSFLTTYASQLHRAKEKALNSYCIFLSESGKSEDYARVLRQIEEDFSSSRKIAAVGVNTRSEIQRALLPILPLKSIAKFHPKEVSELISEDPQVDTNLKKALIEDYSATQIAEYVVESS